MIARFCKALAAVLLAGALTGCAAGLLFGGTAAGVGVVHDRRTAGTIIEDQAIEFKAYHALSGSPGLRETAHVSVTSYNNAVLLSGETPTPELRDQAAAIVGGVDKVRHVYNELAVAPPSSLASRTSDTLLTGKVKT
ncbi:MAG: BON domain-containing protein, partial [Pseudomonadota bacterium]|nr:BON domain-containing protein [Pseudomonadota bacterium]